MDEVVRSGLWRRVVRATWLVAVLGLVGWVVVAITKSRGTSEERVEPEGDVWHLAKVELSLGYNPVVTELVRNLEVAMRPDAVAPDSRPVNQSLRPELFSHHNHAHNLGIHCLLCHAHVGGQATSVDPWAENANNACVRCHQKEPGRVDGAAVPRRRWFVARRDPGKSPKEIDLTECDEAGRLLPGAPLRRGIYEESPGSLRIALSCGSVAADFRPKSFEPALAKTATAEKVGGVAVLHLTK